MMFAFGFTESLTHAVHIVERYGFVNADMAMVNGIKSSSDMIMESLLLDNCKITDRDKLLADDMVGWLMNAKLSGSSEFMDKCRALADTGIKTIGALGMLGAVVVGYQTYMLNKPMIDHIESMTFSNVPLGALKSSVKDLELNYIGTIFLGNNVRETCFITCDNQLVILYKRKDLIDKNTNENYYYNGFISKTDFKYNTLATILWNHRHDIKVK